MLGTLVQAEEFFFSCNYSPIDSSNLHQGDYFPAYLGNMQKVFHIFSE